MDIRQALEERSHQNPNGVALLSLERAPLTYSRLLAHCYRVITELNHAGISRGDRVAVVLPNGPEMATCFLAVSMGASCAPLNPTYRPSEFEFYLSDLAPRALIVQDGIESPTIAVAESRGIRIIRLRPSTDQPAGIFSLDFGGEIAAAAPVFAQPGDEALVLHTSGTTARPKMVPLTHANLTASVENIIESLSLTAHDRCLNVMPLFHVSGIVGTLLASLASGGSVVCTPGLYSSRFFEWCQEFAPTWYYGVPAMLESILARARDHPERATNFRLRFIRTGASPLQPALMAEMERVFMAPVIEGYGLTETAQQICVNPLPPGERKRGSVGIPGCTEIGILGEGGDLLPTGQTGEIVARGPAVMAGYANNPSANRESFINGWFRTGDQGRLDADGYLYITGRIKEIINRGGQKVSPGEIEELIGSHPAVAEAVVFPVPDSYLGEDIAALIVLKAKDSINEHGLRSFVADRVADYKVPRQIHFVDRIPITPDGKVRRIDLAALLGLDRPDAGPKSVNRPTEFIEPRTPTERTLAHIWRQVLQVERIGVHDDFLMLGGDSILAGLVIARIREVGFPGVSRLTFFEHPTLVGLAQAIDRTDSGRSPAGDPIVAAAAGDAFPLSSAQRRMWFLAQFEDNSTAYNRCNVYRIRGPLDRRAVERALSEIVARHAVLRTTYQSPEGEPRQVVSPPGPIMLAQLDLSDEPQSHRMERAVAAATKAANLQFDLTRDPILWPLLVKLDADDHLLVLTKHHIASDGWSAGVLMRELAALYGAFSDRRGVDTGRNVLEPLPIQYYDFAAWQARSTGGGAAQESLEWWKKRLAGAPSLLTLPIDRPRPPRQTFSGATESFVIPSAISDSLKEIARRERATLFVTLLAAFQTMLHRYTGTDDIVVGVPVAGRTRVETEGLIGLFVNMLAMRGDLSGDPTFRELLRKTRDSAFQGYSHQDLPFDMVVESIHPQRNLSYPPIFQVTFQVRNYPLEDMQLAGLEVEEVDFDPGTSLFDLSFEGSEKAGGLFCKLIYNVDLFDRETIARMAGHFKTLLEGIVTDPDTHISRLPILTAAERHQLLIEWNDTGREYPRECVHRLFEQQVERTPDAVAISFEGDQLTYGALNERANHLAHRLVGLGVQPGALVGICIERSLELVVALIGTLKAGAAYLPLDPSYPTERLDFMLEDSGSPVLVTTTSLPEKFTTSGVRVVRVDALDAGDASSLQVPVKPDGDAFVIYTSGSTGKPKGVAISHGGWSNLLHAIRSEIEFSADDVLLAVTTFSFDIASLELFLPLVSGGHVVVASHEVVRNGAGLSDLISRSGATVMQATPATWAMMIELGWSGEPRLKTISGGEALTRSLANKLLERSAGLWNGYGPSETTIYSMIHRVGAGDGPVPIGRPLANTMIHILDRQHELVPAGVVGELYIGGGGVARGYLNRPELTSERFVANPFATNPGERLYRTGDLARRRADGQVEYLGRADDQLKIRGVRVEPGEIEAALVNHSEIQRAAVVAREDAGGSKSLVAYLVSRNDRPPAASTIRSYLRESLPDYMIPSRFAFVASLPLTPSGKIDRANLPPLDASAAVDHRPLVAPRDDIERRLQAIWQELLNTSSIGIHDDFYAVGGHSLLGAKLLARIEREFNRRIPLTAMFPAPTIASIAARIAGDAKDSELPTTVPIQPLGSLPPIFVVGNYPSFRQLALKLSTDRPMIGILIPDEFRLRLPYSLEQLAGLQVKSILELNKGEPIFLIGFSAEGVLAYEVARQLVAAGREVGLVAMIDTACPSQQDEPLILRVARSARIHLREIRSIGLGQAPGVIADVLSRGALRLKFRAWKLASRLGIVREPLAPKRPADLVMAMVLATRRYVPQLYWGRVLLFKQTADREGRFRFEDYGWGEVVRGGLEICEIPGDHLTLLVEPGVATVAAKLDAAMKSACASADESKSEAA
jgi:amino acid adenylation domain-containing protein